MPSVISVKQLNAYLKSLVEGDVRLATVYVAGELSNVKRHFASGHIYFSLKDDSSVIRGVMFNSAANKLAFEPQNGMKVICRGRVSVYERDGQYQLYAENMQPDGAGSLALAFEQLKAKLEKEGLFDSSRKRPLPRFPENIAVITSADAAALRDIVNIISRRWPPATLKLIPAQVQGQTAPASLIQALHAAYSNPDFDLIIIGRGGGSVEDLWAFNDETLARTVAQSPVPIISAVGHETDFTICDFVADLRAPTPSAAAEFAVPDINDVKATFEGLNKRISSAFNRCVQIKELRLNAAAMSPQLRGSARIIEKRAIMIDSLSEKISNAVKKNFAKHESKLAVCAGKLDALSPLKILSRGYAVVSADDRFVASINGLNVGDNISVKLRGGTADCSVDRIILEENNG